MKRAGYKCKKCGDTECYRRADGRVHSCKTCRKKSIAKWQKKNRRRYLKKIVEWQKKRERQLREIANEAKNIPCVDCGKRYPPYVMDFDHRPGETKVACIAELVNKRGPFQTLLNEIDKCDVVCSNCHRERTWGSTR